MSFTRRELDVIGLVVDGRSNKEIADKLCLSVRTVHIYVRRVLKKTLTRSRGQLIATYYRALIRLGVPLQDWTHERGALLYKALRDQHQIGDREFLPRGLSLGS